MLQAIGSDLSDAGRERRAREWRAGRIEEKARDRRNVEILQSLNGGGEMNNPASVSPMRRHSAFPGAYTDGPADVSWNPVDVYGPIIR